VPQVPSAIIVRCDGGAVFGIGHVSRCLTLIEAFAAENVPARFVAADGTGMVGPTLIKRRGFPVTSVACKMGTLEDARIFCDLLNAEADPLAIIDAPEIDAGYLNLIGHYATTLSIHDSPGIAPRADIVLNPHLDATYTDAPGAQLRLLGPRYNLVHSAFFAASGREGNPSRVIVTFGGEDPHNYTRWVLAELGDTLAEYVVEVIIGPAHPDPASIFDIAGSMKNVRIVQDPPDMAKLLVGAMLAITAGGTTCYELAAAGVPQLGFVSEEHQRRLVESLVAADAMLCLGDHRFLDGAAARSRLRQVLSSGTERKRLAVAGRKLLFGPGAPRAARAILAYFAACPSRRKMS
jgi:UDP-2,4-diacetamido-2,4,6-trideoxy-beta-L-altropyranose hydrolase